MSGTETRALAKRGAELAIEQLRGEKMLGEIEAALPGHLGAKRFQRLAITMLRREDLAKCDRKSILAAVMEAAQLGLELDGMLGHAYLVPFKGKATLIPGYRGLIEMALRSGRVSYVDAHVVYEGDEFFEYSFGADARLKHVPTRETDRRGEVTAAYAVVVMKDGGRKFDVMEKADIKAIQDRSPAVRSGRQSPWDTDWPEMAKKTVLRRVLKTAGLSPVITRLVVAEEYYEAGVGQAEPEPGRTQRTRFGFGSAPKDIPVEDVTQPEPEPEPEPEAKAAPLPKSGDRGHLIEFIDDLCDSEDVDPPDYARVSDSTLKIWAEELVQNPKARPWEDE